MCGICGIWSPREQASADPAEAARLMFFSLYALQHRGQESAGIAATDGRDLRAMEPIFSSKPHQRFFDFLAFIEY